MAFGRQEERTGEMGTTTALVRHVPMEPVLIERQEDGILKSK